MSVGERPCEACGALELARAYAVRGHEVVRCRRCGLLFVADPPPPAALASLYGEQFFGAGRKFAGDGGGGARRNARRRLAAIRRPPGTLLDVGCATGDFLLEARDAGWRAAGVEWSLAAAGVAERRGLEVHASSFLETAFGEASFDVVTMWDYIEHVPDPARHLERARRLLRPGGLLVLSTGDTASFFARLCGRRWHLMIPPKHLYFFDRTNVRLLLERADFAVESVRWPGKLVNLGFLAAKGVDLFPSAATRLLARAVERSGLGRLDLYVNLRDIMTVCALAS